MKNLTLILLLVLSELSVLCQAQSKAQDFNFGFENNSSGTELPNNWFIWGSGYNLRSDSLEKHSGKTSLLIEPKVDKSVNSFGCIAYSIPANYNAKKIELRAFMKLKNVVNGSIGLMLRIDGTSSILGFDNMQQKNIQGTSNWTEYSVKMSYPKDAKTIYIGALLSGDGQLWVDDFQVLIDGKDISQVKTTAQKEFLADKDTAFNNGSKISSINLTDSKTEDLLVLGKVWGFLKYYHPAIATGNYNWDNELFRILPKILNSKDQLERNSILSVWVDTYRKVKSGKTKINKEEVKINPDLAWINNSSLGETLTLQLTTIKNAKRTGNSFYIDLVKEVGNPEIKNERPYSKMKFPDTGFRLLCLYRYWNIIQYYYPYKYLIEENWSDVLKEFVPKFVNASNELEYKLAALALIARIHDSHANIWGYHEVLEKYHGVNYAPVIISFVENKAVVTGYYDNNLGENSGLKIGDVIETINNITVDEIIREKLPLTPASNYPTQLRDIASNLLRTNDSLLSISYKDKDNSFTKQIRCYGTDKINIYSRYEKKDTCFKLINSDISYIYPGTIKKDYIPKFMDDISKTKGLIIDMRCYPSEFIVFYLGWYLLPRSTSFVKFSKGSIISPGLFTMTDDLKVGGKNKDYYKGKVVIIVNEETQSQAEYTTMAFRIAPFAKVIGSTTAGADGNIAQFVLPGGIETWISGIGVYYPDGRETQRVGIIPDIEVKPTIKGIREGNDELLEKAIEIINEK